MALHSIAYFQRSLRSITHEVDLTPPYTSIVRGPCADRPTVMNSQWVKPGLAYSRLALIHAPWLTPKTVPVWHVHTPDFGQLQPSRLALDRNQLRFVPNAVGSTIPTGFQLNVGQNREPVWWALEINLTFLFLLFGDNHHSEGASTFSIVALWQSEHLHGFKGCL